MPGPVVRRRDQCCSKIRLPWEAANEGIVAWRSWLPIVNLEEVRLSVRKLADDLQSLTRYSEKQQETEEPEKSCALQEDDTCSRAPAVRAVLRQVGVPRNLSTKMEEMCSVLSMGHVLFPSLGNLIGGYETGMMSLAVMQLTNPLLVGAGWEVLSTWDVGIVISSKFYGSFVGSAVAFDASEMSSRDILILASCGLVVVSAASALAPSPKYLILARVLSGFVEGFSSPARIAYTTETSDASLRFATMGVRTGTFGAGAVLGALFGAALLPIPGAWHIMLGATMLPAVAMGAGMCMLPHSPRWLLSQQGPSEVRRAQAFAALRELRSHGMLAGTSQSELELRVEAEVDAMCSIERECDPKESSNSLASIGNFLQNPVTKTMFWVMFFKQAGGGVAMLYYKANVLAALGLSNHVGLLTALVMTVKALSTPGGALLAGYLGYRNSLLLGSLGSSTSMGLLFLCQATSILSPMASSAVSLVLLVTSTISFEISFGTVSHQLAAELYPQQLRQRGLAWTHLCNAPLKAGCVQLFPFALSYAGPAPMWMALALLNTAGFLTMHQLVPETCGKTLEDIEKERCVELHEVEDGEA